MAAPSVCTISGTTYLGATGQGGTLVRWRVVSATPPVVAGDGHASGDPTVVYAASDGTWSIAPPQGATVWVEIPREGVDHTFTVPSETTATFASLSFTKAFA
jgi:hypothetical protein